MPRLTARDLARVTARMRAAGLIPHGPHPGRDDDPWPCDCVRCGRKNISATWATVRAHRDPCPTCSYSARAVKISATLTGRTAA
ncbi:hypothetical protein ACWC0C_06980 [Streptomyces sp. NPDC001709]